MSGSFVFGILDEDDIPVPQIKQAVVAVSDFVAGIVRDAGNSFAITLPAGTYTEIEGNTRFDTEDDFRIAVVDEDGELLASYLSDADLTVEAPVDATADDWTVDPHITATTFAGATSTQTPAEDGKAYFIGVVHGSTPPLHAHVRAGLQGDGLTPALGTPAKNESVSGGVSFNLTVANILTDIDGTRYESFDGYVAFEDAAGNPLAVFSLGEITIDSAPTFGGNTAGSVNNSDHTVTLGPYIAGSDQFDDSDNLVYIAYYDIGGGLVPFATSSPGENTITADPGIEGEADYTVRAMNTRGLIDDNTATVTLIIGAGIGQYKIILAPPRATNNTGSIIPNTEFDWYFLPAITGKEFLDAIAAGNQLNCMSGQVTSGSDGGFQINVQTPDVGELILFKQGSTRLEDIAFWQTVTPE